MTPNRRPGYNPNSPTRNLGYQVIRAYHAGDITAEDVATIQRIRDDRWQKGTQIFRKEVRALPGGCVVRELLERFDRECEAIYIVGKDYYNKSCRDGISWGWWNIGPRALYQPPQ